jgi:hypothetical protein
MPGRDRTGPGGMGAMSGRGAGYCRGSDVPGSAGPTTQDRFGGGRGHDIRGRGGRGPWRWRHWFSASGRHRWAPFGGGATDPRQRDSENDRQVLETRAAALEEELGAIRKRLEGFKAGTEGE